MEKNKDLKFIDLFCGLGGFRIPLEELGMTCVYSSDIDKYVQEVYANNFGHKPDGDITKINEKDVPDHDILCGGFPCQPFSIGGLRKGFSDTRGTLFFDIERIIREKKPRFFVLENVKGLTNHDKGRTLKVIIDKLANRVNGQMNLFKTEDNLGYNVFYKVLNSMDYGVPQNRERIYIVGFLDDSVDFKFPEKIELKTKLSDIILDECEDTYNISEIAKNNINTHIKNKKIDKSNPVIAYEIRKSKCSFRNDNISPCLTAKMGTGGNNVPVYVKKMRKFTVKECLKIQGFPDWYKIKENNSHSYKQIGNSVSVPVLRAIFKELVKYI